MRRFLLAAMLVLAAASCTTQAQSQRSVGVVTLENYEEGDSLIFFNDDGSTWLSFDPYFREDESSFSMPEGFRPAGFHPDYFVLMLRSLGVEKDSMAAVVVNEQTGEVKYADLRGSALKQVPWSEYLTSLFAISIRQGFGPLRARPRPAAQAVETPEAEARLEPVEVQGDWLRVRWRERRDGHSKHGWIRWRDERDRLLVELHPFA